MKTITCRMRQPAKRGWLAMLVVVSLVAGCTDSNDLQTDQEPDDSEPLAASALPTVSTPDSSDSNDSQTEQEPDNSEPPATDALPIVSNPDPSDSNDSQTEQEPDDSEPPATDALPIVSNPDPADSNDSQTEQGPDDSESPATDALPIVSNPDPSDSNDSQTEQGPDDSEPPATDALPIVSNPDPSDSNDSQTEQEPDVSEPPTAGALPIALNPYPSNSVTLSDQNALNVSSAVYRSQRVVSALSILAADLQQQSAGLENENISLMSLGNEFCETGDGSIQADSAPFEGAENPLLISLNGCMYRGTEATGAISVAQYNGEEGNWTIIEMNNVTLEIEDASGIEDVTIITGRFRSQIDLGVGETLIVVTVGEAIDMVLDGYAVNAAPFESTISRNQEGTQTTVQTRLSINTELLGGTVFGKTSIPIVLDETGLALSGNFTLQGMGSPVIEWFSGTSVTLPEGFDESTTYVLADIRSNSGQTFVGNTWAEFLTAF